MLKCKHDTSIWKRFSPKKAKENEEYFLKQLNEEHVGHTIQYYANSHKNNFGEIVRANVDSIGIFIMIKNPDSPFPIQVRFDQLQGCSCTKKEPA